jgi:hypothetical protein
VKVKKHIAFYTENRETGVPELRLLDEARRIVLQYAPPGTYLSVEDYIRSVALDHAARVVQAESGRRSAVQEQLNAAPTDGDRSEAAMSSEVEDGRNETGDGGLPSQDAVEVDPKEVVAVLEGADAGQPAVD